MQRPADKGVGGTKGRKKRKKGGDGRNVNECTCSVRTYTKPPPIKKKKKEREAPARLLQDTRSRPRSQTGKDQSTPSGQTYARIHSHWNGRARRRPQPGTSSEKLPDLNQCGPRERFRPPHPGRRLLGVLQGREVSQIVLRNNPALVHWI